MKKQTLALCIAAAVTPQLSASEIISDQLIWKAVTFGQSTDLNFGSTILPEKVGVNQVSHEGALVEDGPVLDVVTIESRGGKLANSHEGLTFYYTEIPTDYNFTLAADIELEQLGPETGATPNRQEGAGIMVRDILGAERLMPQPEGHEEFPSASNMVMNLLRSHTRTNDGMTNINASFREGVYQPWGTSGNRLSRVDYVEGVEYGSNTAYRMSLTRNNEHFEVSYKNGEVTERFEVKGANANITEMQNPDSQYIGFFASRNAKVTISNIELELSPAQTIDAPAYQAKAVETIVEIASPLRSSSDQYPAQARANYTGTFELFVEDKLITSEQVAAGTLFNHLIDLDSESTRIAIHFTPIEGPSKGKMVEEFEVTKHELPDPMNLYVSPDASSRGTGSLNEPLNLATAIELIPAGGTIHLLSGDYQQTTLPITASGTEDNVKHIKAAENGVRFIGDVNHDANYWHYEGIEVAGARFIVHGSHNTFEKMVTHSAPDTGFQITSPENVGRALWASYNTVIDSESYNNMDPSQINADGFAAKMRVGDGNTFIRCIAHHNIDDGWDLFNKVEDGPNGAVTILDSIAFNNGRTLDVANKGGTIGNGFKLGGEGIPVPHVIKNSLSFNNNMDGFTDNFNPGSVTVVNNMSIDNNRFNYLFRQSPYSDEIKQGTFEGNVSYRFQTAARYDDVVHSEKASHNLFIYNGLTSDDLGTPINLESLQKIKRLTKIDASADVPAMTEAKAIKALLDTL
ncbi:right-handed parallel beta-helix repeat-containing protein [Vibrio astriarenae]